MSGAEMGKKCIRRDVHPAHEWPGFAPDRWQCPGVTIQDLVERSSLGTPEAQALRATVSDERAARIVARAETLTTSPPPEVAPEDVGVIERAASLLAELYDPAGVLIFWSSRIKYLDNKRPCDLWRDRDIAALRMLCTHLDQLADGNF